MTSRERILTAIGGGTPDRVPVVARMWKFLRKYYGDIPGELNRLLRMREEFGNDIVAYAAQPPLPCHSPLLKPWRDDVEVEGSEWVSGGMTWYERTIHTPAGDLHDLKRRMIVKEGSGAGPEIVEPLVKDFKSELPRMRYMMADPKTIDLAQWRRYERRIGERGVVFASMMSCIDCREVLKQQDMLMLYHDDREAFREIVRIGGEAMMAETKRVLDAGMRVIKTWWFYASPSAGWSPKIYEDMFLPWAVKQVELVHSYDGAVYIYYDDGRMKKFIDMYVDAGIDVLMTLAPPPLGDADPDDVKGRFGDRVCLMGGFDAVNEVWRSTPDDIRETVRRRLDVYKPDGAYIMDGSNSLVYETPVGNVKAFVEAGIQFGGY